MVGMEMNLETFVWKQPESGNDVHLDMQLMVIYDHDLQMEVALTHLFALCKKLVFDVLDELEVELPVVDYAEQPLVLVFCNQ